MTARELQKEMKLQERAQMVKAMEFICRNLNNEDQLMIWLTDGVADGDIEYGDLRVAPASEALDDVMYYIEDDERFADLMDTFLYCMRKAHRDGGLYCNGVVSKAANS